MTPKLHVQHHADGRRSFPQIVQYRVGNELVDLPPTVSTHRDMTPARAGAQPEGCRSVPWKPVIHDRAAYDRLWLAGVLHIGHVTVDSRCIGE